ncbi:MAG: type IV pilus secretin PilQ [Myxococcota bacterium]
MDLQHPKVVWLGFAAAVFSTAASAETMTTLEHVEASRDGETRIVRIRADRAPSYSVFRMTEPDRVFVELSDARTADGAETLDVRDGVVRSVRTENVDERTLRVVIELEAFRDYRIIEKGKELWVRFEAAALRTPIDVGEVEVEESAEGSLIVAPLTGELKADAVRLESIESPPRIIVDLDHARIEPKYQRLDVDREGVQRVRVADKSGSVRLVLDLDEGAIPPRVDVQTAGRQLQIRLSSATSKAVPRALPAPPVPAAATAPSTTPTEAPSPSLSSAASRAIRDIRFEPRDGFIRFTVVFENDTFRVASGGSESAPRLLIPDAKLPKHLERTLDVTEVSKGALAGLSSFNTEKGVVLAAGIYEKTEHRHWTKGDRLMWDFRLGAQTTSYAPETTASYRSEMAAQLGAAATGRARYTGRRISLDLKDADIQNVLRLLADVSRLNIVAGDDVQGKVTIKLRNVPWDQALDIILKSKALDKQRNGNIIRVAPVEVLQKEEELRLERREAQIQLEPLTVRLIPVSYAVASDIRPQVAALLSARGKVNIDKRTNVLIVEDIGEVLVKVERLVRTLDTQTPQVLIESRIVEARNNFSRELGVQWGGTVSASQQFGTQTGLEFPNNVVVSGGADDGVANVVEGVAANPQYAVNLPAVVGSGTGGALGLVLGSVDNSTLINLRLSAAETEGKIKLVSAPKIVTLDNTEANILSGERIPITVITANGPTTRFINANLELGVTPHVTQDGAILMDIEAKKNELSDRVDNLGVPGILTNEANTSMIVQDGDTAVLGGLYRRNRSENEARIPWIGQVPVIGWLFKSTTRSDSREELLIFISPRIVNRQAALVQPE